MHTLHAHILGNTYKIEREMLKANLAHILGDTCLLTDRWSLEEKNITSPFPPPQLLFPPNYNRKNHNHDNCVIGWDDEFYVIIASGGSASLLNLVLADVLWHFLANLITMMMIMMTTMMVMEMMTIMSLHEDEKGRCVCWATWNQNHPHDHPCEQNMIIKWVAGLLPRQLTGESEVMQDRLDTSSSPRLTSSPSSSSSSSSSSWYTWYKQQQHHHDILALTTLAYKYSKLYSIALDWFLIITTL